MLVASLQQGAKAADAVSVMLILILVVAIIRYVFTLKRHINKPPLRKVCV